MIIILFVNVLTCILYGEGNKHWALFEVNSKRNLCVSLFAVLSVYGITHRMHASMCWVVIKPQSGVCCGTQRFLTSSFQVRPLYNHLLLSQLFCDQYAISVYTDEPLVSLSVVMCVSTYWLSNSLTLSFSQLSWQLNFRQHCFSVCLQCVLEMARLYKVHCY